MIVSNIKKHYFDILRSMDIEIYLIKDGMDQGNHDVDENSMMIERSKNSDDIDSSDKRVVTRLGQIDSTDAHLLEKKKSDLSIPKKTLDNEKRQSGQNTNVPDLPQQRNENQSRAAKSQNKPSGTENQSTGNEYSDILSDDFLPELRQNTLSLSEFNEFKDHISGCSACSLSMSRQNVLFGRGNDNANLMLIADVPSEKEDKVKSVFVDEEEALLTAMLTAINISIDDVFITNIVKCSHVFPIPYMGDEVQQCSLHLRKQIEFINPKLILVMGHFPAKALLKKEEPLDQLRRKIYRYQTDPLQIAKRSKTYPLIVSYHPRDLIKHPQNKTHAWYDLKQVAKMIK